MKEEFEHAGKKIKVYTWDDNDRFAYEIEGGGYGCNLTLSEARRLAKKVAEQLGKKKE